LIGRTIGVKWPGGLPLGQQKAVSEMSTPTAHDHVEYPAGETGFSLGLKGACPRCGKGHLFSGWLKLAPECEVCGLDFSFADPADGPAFFAQWVGCIPAFVFALWIEVVHAPPFWVHLVTTLPILILPCLLLLRPLKGWLVCTQYITKAEEGRLQLHDRPSQSGTSG